MIWYRVLNGIAAATITANGLAMGLAVLADDWKVFTFSYAAAGLAGYGLIFFKEAQKRMGHTHLGYRNLAMRLRWELREEGFKAGDQLPNHRDLAKRFGTTRTTVRRALALLAEEHLIEVAHGKGTYVVGDGAAGPVSRGSHVEQHILKVVAEGRVVQNAELLAMDLGVSPSTARRAARRLIERGIIVRRADGKYEAAA